MRSQLDKQQTLIEGLREHHSEQKAQLAKLEQTLKAMETRDAVEMQQLRLQLHLMMNRCEVNLRGVRMMMAITQMPHEQLRVKTLVYEWNIKDIKRDAYGRISDTRYSEVFPITGYHYGGQAFIDYTSRYIQLQLIDYNKTNIPINATLMPKLTWIIESQSPNTQDNQHVTTIQRHGDHIITRSIGFNESLSYGGNIYGWESLLFSPILNSPYLVSSGMKLRLYIEPPSIARSFFSNDGILLWRLDNYKGRKQMERDGLIWWQESPYFYTSPQGYRVFIVFYLSEKTIDGGLWFVKGDNDRHLPYEFSHRLTVTIFNHTDPSKNLVVRKEASIAYYTTFKFAKGSFSLFDSGGYVKDDSLLIKAEIKSMSKKFKCPWRK